MTRRRPGNPAPGILLVIVLLVGVVFVWARTPPPPNAQLIARVEASAKRPCARIEIVGLRGYGDTLDNWSGAGADVSALARILSSRLDTRRSPELFGLPYEQGPSPLGLPLSVPRDVPPAAAVLDHYVEHRAEACPEEHLILAGQSEGAAVAHWAYPGIASRVDALVLLGDPLHLPSAPYDEDSHANGGGQLLIWLALDPLSLSFRDQIGDKDGKVRSYCLAHDVVCSFDPFDRHSNTHLDYRRNPSGVSGREGVLDVAADFVMTRLIGLGNGPSSHDNSAQSSVDYERRPATSMDRTGRYQNTRYSCVEMHWPHDPQSQLWWSVQWSRA